MRRDLVVIGASAGGIDALRTIVAALTVVVQDPADAVVSSMPRNALDHAKVDHCLPLGEIPALLIPS